MASNAVPKLPSFVDCLVIILLITSSFVHVGHCQQDSTEERPSPLFQTAGTHGEGSPDETSDSLSCSEPGYHADASTGCRKYHHCGKLLDGTWRKITLSCPSGTSFDQSRLGCIPGHVPCGQLEDSTAVTAVNAGQNIPPEETVTESVPTLAGDKDVPSANKEVVGKNKSPLCPHSFGYFPDVESNCRRYYACVTLKKDTVYTHYFECPGVTRFDREKMLCVKPKHASPCKAFTEDDLRTRPTDVHSLSAGEKTSWNLTLTSEKSVDHMDRVIANYILSHVRPEARQQNGSVLSSQYLTEVQPLPQTMLAALKLIHVNLGSVTNDTGLLRQYANQYGKYGVYVGSALIQHGKSAIGNITEYVNGTNLDTMSKYIRVSVALDPLKKAYDSVRRVFLPGSHGSPPAGVSAQDVKYLEELGAASNSSKDTSANNGSSNGLLEPSSTEAPLASSGHVTPRPTVNFSRHTTPGKPQIESHQTQFDQAPSADPIVIRPASHVSRPLSKLAAVQAGPGYHAPAPPRRQADAGQKVKLTTATPLLSKQRVSDSPGGRITADEVARVITQSPPLSEPAAVPSYKKPPQVRPIPHPEVKQPSSSGHDYVKFYEQLFKGMNRDSPASQNFGQLPGLTLSYGYQPVMSCCGPVHPMMTPDFDDMRYAHPWTSHLSEEWKK
ncbi:unnamed protein product [Ixodes persulcatus]